MKKAIPLCDKWALYKYHWRMITGLGQVPRIHLAKQTVTVLQPMSAFLGPLDWSMKKAGLLIALL